jgi:hypothetical protein
LDKNRRDILCVQAGQHRATRELCEDAGEFSRRQDETTSALDSLQARAQALVDSLALKDDAHVSAALSSDRANDALPLALAPD